MTATLLALQSSHLIAAPASPSELLEKGIYTEETKGDIDGAMAIYQQLLGEAKANQSFAAQAQLRLGQCLLKKNRIVEATAAFEKVIRDYPEQKELVAKAREHLPNSVVLGPVPWVDGERMVLVVNTATGVDMGVIEYRIARMEVNGREVWRTGARVYAGVHSVSHVDADVETFRPIASRWKHQLLGEASASFRDGEMEFTMAGKAPVVTKSEAAFYDNEQVVHLMRRLPLAIGYKIELPVYSSLGGGAIVPIGLEVTAKESVTTPMGEFECFKVTMSVGQSFWYSADAHRYLVKFEAGGITASLIFVGERKMGEPVVFRDESLGVSLTAPAEWVIHQRQGERKPGEEVIYMLDAEGDADVVLRIFPSDKLSPAARSTPRGWAEEDIKNLLAKNRKDFVVRADSWKTLAVGGHPAISFVADFTEQNKPKSLFAIYGVGPKRSEAFELDCASDKFDALKPAIESIASSYRTR